MQGVAMQVPSSLQFRHISSRALYPVSHVRVKEPESSLCRNGPKNLQLFLADVKSSHLAPIIFLKDCNQSGSSLFHLNSSSSITPVSRGGATNPYPRASTEKDRKKSGAKDKKSGHGGGQPRGETKPPAKPRPKPNVWSSDFSESTPSMPASPSTNRRNAGTSTSSKVSTRGKELKGRPGKEGGGRSQTIEKMVSDSKGVVDQAAVTRLDVDSEMLEDDSSAKIFVSEAMPVEIERVLQTAESVISPIWTTFASSNAGVWRGVGAAFSPITAEMEPVALGRKDEYLYDARVLCTVSAAVTGMLHRQVLWAVENPHGEQCLNEVEVQADSSPKDSGKFVGEGVNPFDDELESANLEDADFLEMAVQGGEEGAAVEDLLEDGDFQDESIGVGSWEEETEGGEVGEGLYTTEGDLKDGAMLKVEDAEWESMWRESDAIDEGWEGGFKGLSGGSIEKEGPDEHWFKQGATTNGTMTAIQDAGGEIATWRGVGSSEFAVAAPAGEASLEKGDAGDWDDVMEEDDMAMELGLVFFEDGSYSRGPLEILAETPAASDKDYFSSPTFKIEQCLVCGGHQRLRVVHTISIIEGGEEIQVLRVAVYEEEWMGPCNMKSISDSGGNQLKPFSQKPRVSPHDLTGSWKVFEINAMAIHPASGKTERPTFVYSCKEVIKNRGLPELIDEAELEDVDDPSFLWLPGGVIASVEAKEEGILTIGVGWLCADGTRLVMERDYGPDGKLAEVRSQSEVKGGWLGGRM